MSKIEHNWMRYNIEATSEEVLDSVMDVVNDMIKKHNIKIQWQSEEQEGCWYKVDFFEEVA